MGSSRLVRGNSRQWRTRRPYRVDDDVLIALTVEDEPELRLNVVVSCQFCELPSDLENRSLFFRATTLPYRANCLTARKPVMTMTDRRHDIDSDQMRRIALRQIGCDTKARKARWRRFGKHHNILERHIGQSPMRGLDTAGTLFVAACLALRTGVGLNWPIGFSRIA